MSGDKEKHLSLDMQKHLGVIFLIGLSPKKPVMQSLCRGRKKIVSNFCVLLPRMGILPNTEMSI